MTSVPPLLIQYTVLYAIALISPLWILPIAAILAGAAMLSVDMFALAMAIPGLIFGLAARGVRYKYDVPWRRAWPIIAVGLLISVPLSVAVLNPYNHPPGFAP